MVDLTDAVRHLLMSFPDEGNDDLGWAASEGLILRSMVALLESGSSNPLAVAELVRHVHEETSLAFDSSEVHEVLTRLQKQGKVAFTDRDEYSVALDPDVRRKLIGHAARRRDLEERVREEWFREYLKDDDSLEYEEAEGIWMGLKQSLARLINSRAAEAASFLYLDRPDARLKFESILQEPRGFLGSNPEDDSYPPQVQQELVAFLSNVTEDRSEYLIGLLGAAFRFHLLSLDPEASRLAKSVLQGKRFYLDTNFLFRLLALQGPREAHAPAMIMEFAEELESKVVVARATLQEFKSTIKYHSKRLRQYRLTREDFKRIAAGYATTDLDFMAQFYRELQSGRISGIDEFESKYLQIERAVEEWGIEIDETVKFDDDLLATLSDRVNAVSAWHGGEKTRASCEHDVLLEHFVRQRRVNSTGGINDIQTWFLTYDRRLTRFGYANPIDDECPVQILAGDWLQIIRQFSPRTTDYAQAFISLLASPLLVDDTAPPIRDVVGALKRLERYEGLSETVVAGMIAEREFIKRLNEATDPEDEKRIVELQVAHIATALEERMKALESLAKKLEFDRDKGISD